MEWNATCKEEFANEIICLIFALYIEHIYHNMSCPSRLGPKMILVFSVIMNNRQFGLNDTIPHDYLLSNHFMFFNLVSFLLVSLSGSFLQKHDRDVKKYYRNIDVLCCIYQYCVGLLEIYLRV